MMPSLIYSRHLYDKAKRFYKRRENAISSKRQVGWGKMSTKGSPALCHVRLSKMKEREQRYAGGMPAQKVMSVGSQ